MMRRLFPTQFKLAANASRSFSHHAPAALSVSQAKIIELELEKSAHNYHPIPVVLSRGLGCNVWDVDGKVS